MTVNEIKKSLNDFSDDDLDSLMTAIRAHTNERKNERIKTAFEAFKDAAINLDKMSDIYYDIAGDDHTMEDIVNAVRYSFQIAGYDI